MKLLSPDDAAGNGPSQQPASNPTPPPAAETVASGKSEREKRLEHQNKRLLTVARQTADAKRKVEIKNAELEDRVHQLKQVPTAPAQPAKEKTSWMGFSE